MKLVFATNNLNKLKEVTNLIKNQIKVINLNDINCDEDILETENTISGNAILKANYIKTNYGFDCFADDTGLEVDFLNGNPGVFSKRFAGENSTDELNMQKLLNDMKVEEAMEFMQDRMKRTKSNEEFLDTMSQ